MGPQNAPSIATPYSSVNENLRTFWSYFYHGTMVAPKQGKYDKEVKGKENQKMRTLC